MATAQTNNTIITPQHALTILGLEGNDAASTAQSIPQAAGAPSNDPPTRPQLRDRRTSSYYNPFSTKCAPSTDSPPSYGIIAHESRFAPSRRHWDNGNEVLPKYTCTVEKEGIMSMRVEALSPFQPLAHQEWRDVYVVMRGTALYIHKVKTMHLGKLHVASAGRLLRRFTLQHAEVGLASDISYCKMEPTTRLAHLIPNVARKRAFDKDPDLFRLVRQCSMRIRAETDQFLLADPSEQEIFDWVNKICAGIDIAFDLDERGIPRQCTMPRRRRRSQRAPNPSDLSDRRLIEEQEQILRDLYPALASSSDAHILTPNQQHAANELGRTTTNDQENEEIDLSALTADITSHSTHLAPTTTNNTRPNYSRQTTVSTIASANLVPVDSALGAPTTGMADAKWAPVHPRTAAQQARYIARCMPVLPYDAPRASSIMYCAGRRMRLNLATETMQNWELAPPSYDSHGFEERRVRLSVETVQEENGGVDADAPRGDEIERSPALTLDLGLEKMRSRGESTKGVTASRTAQTQMQMPVAAKGPQTPDTEAPVMVFGF